MKNSSVYVWHKWFKESSNVEITMVITFFNIKSILLFTMNSFHKAKESTQLIRWKY
jgi:hypothetical protein